MDFFGALAAWFNAAPAMASVFPGGLVNARAPASILIPYCRSADVDPVRPETLEDYTFESVLSCYATDDDAAMAAGASLWAAIKDTSRTPLMFDHEGATWTEIAVRRLPETRLAQAGMAADGAYVFRWDQVFEFLARKV